MPRAPIVSLALLLPLGLPAQSVPVKWGGFVDAYYAWDSGRPRRIDRAVTTQAVRHGEFNVNLAYLEAVLGGDKVRGRLALQAGTSVQANYAGEPTTGAFSGPSLARHIQEAVVGVRVATRLWADGGIFLAHTGSESWISRDNPTYTRSLIADFSPFYASGARLTWVATPSVTATVVLANGWQIISENNSDKSFGGRVDWRLTPRMSVAYYNLIGNEQPDTAPSRVRYFNGITAKWAGRVVTVIGTVDGGRQETDTKAAASWWGGSLITRLQFSERWGVAGRVEAFEDPDRALIVAGGAPFRASGASIGFDMAPAAGVLWRTEVRSLHARHAVFPSRTAATGRTKDNTGIVTSLSVSF